MGAQGPSLAGDSVRKAWENVPVGNCSTATEREKLLFFSEDAADWAEAKTLCETCPILRTCLKISLDSAEVDGVWGGIDEMTRRRTLGIDSAGAQARRARGPQCPFCGAGTASLGTWTRETLGGRWPGVCGVLCGVCGLEWTSRTSKNEVERHNAV